MNVNVDTPTWGKNGPRFRPINGEPVPALFGIAEDCRQIATRLPLAVGFATS
jgi:hypothetical protein